MGEASEKAAVHLPCGVRKLRCRDSAKSSIDDQAKSSVFTWLVLIVEADFQPFNMASAVTLSALFLSLKKRMLVHISYCECRHESDLRQCASS